MNLPETKRLGHGISVIPLPLPFTSPAWVNVYAIESGDGLLLIDCGVDWEEGHDRLHRGLEDLDLADRPIHTLVVSHLHPDHVGMAPRLVEETGCRLILHRNSLHGIGVYNDTPALMAWTAGFAVRHGVPETLRSAFAALFRPDWMPLLSQPTDVVDDGDEIDLGPGRRLEVLHTPGHEHSHMCLRDSLTGILFSGDHILPRITPVIMWDHTDLDVLGLYLSSVSRLAGMKLGLTYPAHGTIVERGSQRAEQILLHHDRRLSTMEDILGAGPLTAWQVMGHAFRPNLNTLEQRLALRETVSHLEHLRLLERIARFESDTTSWYRTA